MTDLLALEVAKSGEAAKSGPIGLAVILLLCIACYFLFKSMSKHMRKVREDFPVDESERGDGGQGGSGSGRDGGSPDGGPGGPTDGPGGGEAADADAGGSSGEAGGSRQDTADGGSEPTAGGSGSSPRAPMGTA